MQCQADMEALQLQKNGLLLRLQDTEAQLRRALISNQELGQEIQSRIAEAREATDRHSRTHQEQRVKLKKAVRRARKLKTKVREWTDAVRELTDANTKLEARVRTLSSKRGKSVGMKKGGKRKGKGAMSARTLVARRKEAFDMLSQLLRFLREMHEWEAADSGENAEDLDDKVAVSFRKLLARMMRAGNIDPSSTTWLPQRLVQSIARTAVDAIKDQVRNENVLMMAKDKTNISSKTLFDFIRVRRVSSMRAPPMHQVHQSIEKS